MTGQLRPFTSLALLTASATLSVFAAAQQVPAQLQPPENEKLFLTLYAKGDQIYTCKADGSQYSWVLKAPDADLFDADGNLFGKHFAGPSWMASDTSRVNGKAMANAPSPDSNSIPWLLVHVVSHEGTGVLTRASSIQRLYTKGGKAPASGCDAEHVDHEFRAPYTADYLFFAPK
jgi:Protein of unknown function (DUF3455)